MRDTNELERARRIIDEVDLSAIEKHLVLENLWTKNQVKAVMAQYRNYLYLKYKYPNEILPPSEDITEVWSAHILDTKSYVDFCNELFGTYLHKISEYNNLGTDGLDRAFEQLNLLYQKEFGSAINEVHGVGPWNVFLSRLRYIHC